MFSTAVSRKNMYTLSPYDNECTKLGSEKNGQLSWYLLTRKKQALVYFSKRYPVQYIHLLNMAESSEFFFRFRLSLVKTIIAL